MTAGPVAYSSNSFTTNAPPWRRRRVSERHRKALLLNGKLLFNEKVSVSENELAHLLCLIKTQYGHRLTLVRDEDKPIEL